MEFFRIIDKQITEVIIQENITPKSLDKFTETMFFLNSENENFKAGTIWGEFLIGYSKINGGIRFSLLSCPNALTWTITSGYPPEPNKIVLHCTINRTQITDEFEEEINEFLEEWEAGLTKQF